MTLLLRSLVHSRWAPLLSPISLAYGKVAAWRRSRLSARSVRLSVPVISVGNITCGGTGKTPAVEMIARDLLSRGRKPAILSRGYRSDPQGVNDEKKLLALDLPEVPHYANPDRIQAGFAAIADGADVLVLDDGFQHVRLERDLDLVLIDALDPFGGGRVLPAGLLREPLEALHSADLIAITRCALVPSTFLGILRGLLRDRFPGIPRMEMEAEPIAWEDPGGGSPRPPGALRGKRVAAFAGIGNPEAFRRGLLKLGLEVHVWMPFPDHCRYRMRHLEEIRRKAQASGVDAVVTTGKDAVKIPKDWSPGQLPWYVLKIAFRAVAGADLLQGAIDRVLRESPGKFHHPVDLGVKP